MGDSAGHQSLLRGLAQLALAAGCLLPALVPAAPPFVDTDQVIVRVRGPGVPAPAAAAARGQSLAARLAQAETMTHRRVMGDGSHVMKLFRRMPVQAIEALSRRFANDPEIVEILPDRIALPALIPSDPQRPAQWTLTASQGVNAFTAWDLSTGSPNLIVGIVDTGKLDHPDLAGRWLPGYDFVDDVTRSSDGDGRDANAADTGDWVTQAEAATGPLAGCTVTASRWHGTAMAGVIAATANNGVGIAGLNWNSKLLPVRAIGKCGGYTSDIVDGLRWAAGIPVPGAPANPNTIDVANVSLATSGGCDPAWQSAINELTNLGIPVIVAAGNNSATASSYSPANCIGVITVGAVDRNGQLPDYANSGAIIAVSAPGGVGNGADAVLTTFDAGTTTPANDGSYAAVNGTSIATAHVTGVASLMLSMNPTLLPYQVKAILQANARSFPTDNANSQLNCNTSLCGAGIVDATRSVQSAKVFGSGSPRPTADGGSYGFFVGLRSDGLVFDWISGENPALRADISGVRGISVFGPRALAVRIDGTLWSWTHGPYQSTGAEQVAGIGDVAKASLNSENWLALKTDGTVWASGSNSQGQLGDGTTTDRYLVQVSGVSNATAIAAGYGFSLAAKADGTVWAWGYNGYGQMGDGTVQSFGPNHLVPTQVSGLTNVLGVAAGANHSMALRSDGTLWSWGSNFSGELGDGTTIGRTTPVQVTGLSNVVALRADGDHCMALKADGTVWVWGNGTGSLVPAQVAGLANIASIGAFIAVREDGSVFYISGTTSGIASGPGGAGILNLDLAATSFASLVNAGLGSVHVSNTIVMNGIANGSVISVTGGEYSINGGAYTGAQGTINAGQSVTLQMTASSNCATTSSAIVTIAGVARSFTVTTIACDTTPDPPGEFDTQGNLDPGTLAVSNAITVGGINAPIPISVVGGEYSIGCNATFTSAAGMIGPNLQVCVRQSASANEDTITNTVLSVGPYSRVFQVITRSNAAFSTAPMIAYNNGGLYLGLRSDGRLYEWGVFAVGEPLRNPALRADIGGLRSISVYGGFVYAVRGDGTLWTWRYGYPVSSQPWTTPAQVPGITGVSKVSAGLTHLMVLKTDGTVWAAGNNSQGQLGDGTTTDRSFVQVSGIGNALSIAAGDVFSLAAKADGTVWAWGYNGYGQMGDGTLQSFGSDHLLPHQVPGLANVIAVAAGANHSMALRSDGTLWAWGKNDLGQIGDGSTVQRTIPVQVTTLSNVTALLVYGDHSMALKADGTVWVWGEGRLVPAQVAGLANITAIGNNMAVRNDGAAFYISGTNSDTVAGPGGSGTLNLDLASTNFTAQVNAGLGSVHVSNTIVMNGIANGSVISVTGGEYSINGGAYTGAQGTINAGQSVTLQMTASSNCATTSSAIVTIAGVARSFTVTTIACDTTPDPPGEFDTQGNLDPGTLAVSNAITVGGINAPIPISVVGGEYSIGCNATFTSAAGMIGPNLQVCVRQSASANEDTITNTVLSVGPYSRVFQVITRSNAAFSTAPMIAYNNGGLYLGLRSDGRLYEWGVFAVGEPLRNPALRADIGGLRSISVYGGFVYAVRGDGTLWTWRYGYPVSSQPWTTPAQVPGITGVSKVSAGLVHLMALKTDGTVLASGNNSQGQLGDGTTTDRSFVQVSGMSNATAIAAGYGFSLAAKADGTVWAWGYNGYGQMGDGTVQSSGPDHLLPNQVPGLANVTAVAAGEQHSMALRSDGTLWAWGKNDAGQVGDGSTVRRSIPVQVTGLSNVVALLAYGDHSMALKADGTVWVWGEGRLVPAQVAGLANITAIGNNMAVRNDGAAFYISGTNSDTVAGPGGSGTLNLDLASTNFTAQVNAGLGSVHVSNTIVMNGIANGSVISVTGGEYSINGGAYTGAQGTINAGQSVTLQMTASSNCATTSSAIVTIAGVARSFTVTTIACDTTPDPPGEFDTQGNLDPGTLAVSNAITVGGINAPIPISVVGGEYSIGCNATFTSAAGMIGPNLQVCVRQSASANEDTITNTVLSVGPYSRVFQVITRSNAAFSTAPMIAYNNGGLYLGLRSDGRLYEWGVFAVGEPLRNPALRADIGGLRSISVYGGFVYAVRGDGTLWTWRYGYPVSSQPWTTPAQVPGITGVSKVSAGLTHLMVLKTDGTVWAAGNNSQGQLGDGTTTDRSFVQVSGIGNALSIAAGDVFSLAAKADGTVWAWGYNGYGQMGDGTLQSFGSDHLLPHQVPGLANVIAVAAGANHSMALRSDGTLWAWGKNDLGQIGDGSTVQRTIPVQVTTLSNVTALLVYGDHSMALKADGTVWVWGEGRLVPAQVAGLANITAIGNNMAVRNDGAAFYISGTNSDTVAGPGGSGTLDLVLDELRPDPFTFLPVFGAPLATQVLSNTITVSGLRASTPSPITVAGGEISINGGAYSPTNSSVVNGNVVRVRLTSASSYESLASAKVTIGGVTGASSTFFTQTQRDPALPAAVPAISLGESHSVLLTANGNVLAFGYNANGQLGNGSTFSGPVLTPAAGVGTITNIASGANHVLALKNDGTVIAWGYNASGQLGDGTTASNSNAAAVPGISFVKAIDAGRFHSLALRTDKTVWAWGLNSEGQVGDGSTVPTRLAAQQVPGLSDATAIAAGGRHSLALLSNGTVLAWGANESGQLGDGTTTLRRSPVLASISGVIAIAAGESHSMAIKSDGTVWAWGANGFGQLGIGTTANSATPVQVTALGSDVGLIACGEKHSLAVKAGGAMYAWGNNANSQLGNGANANSSTPLQLITPTSVVAISGGARHSAAIDASRRLYVWGDNFFGQVGNTSGNFNPHAGNLNVLRGDTKISEGVPPSGGSVGTGGNAGSSLIDIDGQGGAFDFGSFAAPASITKNGRFQNQSPTDNIDSISFAVTGNGFSMGSTNCPLSLSPGAECTFTVAFNPAGASSYAGELVVTSNVVGSPERRSLSGIGVATAALTLEKGFLSFPPQLVGSSSTVANFAVTNTGNATLVVSSVTGSVPAFSATHNCASVAPGASCNLAVTFTPSAPNTQYGYLILASNSAGSPQTLTVSGTGVATTAVPSPSLTGVVSRKTHAVAGSFDLAIDTAQPLGGAVTVEPRAAASHKVVFQFNAAITAPGTASVSPLGSVSTLVNGSAVEVTVSGVPNNTRVTVSLANVNNAGGNVSASLAFAVGDTDSTRTVDATDLAAIKAKAGEVIDATSFRRDLNLSGAITASDILIAKGRLGTSVP